MVKSMVHDEASTTQSDSWYSDWKRSTPLASKSWNIHCCLPVKSSANYAVEHRLFGFLTGAVASGAGMYYYVVDNYRVSNELLTEDIYVRRTSFCAAALSSPPDDYTTPKFN